MRMTIHIGIMLGALTGALGSQPAPPSVRHVTVFREADRFGGWPANHGIWSWGNEILVGFEVGFLRSTERGHAIDYERPADHVLARSLDGGETWTIERPEGLRPPPGEKVAGVPSRHRYRRSAQSRSRPAFYRVIVWA